MLEFGTDKGERGSKIPVFQLMSFMDGPLSGLLVRQALFDKLPRFTNCATHSSLIKEAQVHFIAVERRCFGNRRVYFEMFTAYYITSRLVGRQTRCNIKPYKKLLYP